MFEAKIVADSICNGQRLTTMQLTHPRIIHAEFMTHRMFARNASSSRAIPFKKMLQRVQEDPFIPLRWPLNEKGMQSYVYLDGYSEEKARRTWLDARDAAIVYAQSLADQNVHKQLANRLIEPWMWITVCVTGDKEGWHNFFLLYVLIQWPKIIFKKNLTWLKNFGLRILQRN